VDEIHTLDPPKLLLAKKGIPMKTLKTLALLAVVTGSLLAVGLSTAQAGGYGYGHGHGYGYGYGYRPVIVNTIHYPHVNLHCDAYGCHYFLDSYGLRHNCFHSGISGRYFYLDSYGAKHFVLGY
jgi:hypothetical protein